MRKIFRKKLLIALSCAMLAMSSSAIAAELCPEGQYYFAAETPKCIAKTPADVWTDLLAGNARYTTTGFMKISPDSQPAPRQLLATSGQKPEAIIITCSDSRLPPEVLFDAGLGKLFVVRVAGNVLSKHELGSIEYAIEHLGTRTIVVLGHEKCGAVKATYDASPSYTGVDPADGIGSLITSIRPAVDKIIADSGAPKTGDATQIDACVVENTKEVADQLAMGETAATALGKEGSDIIKEYLTGIAADPAATPPVEGRDAVKIYKAYYKLDTGVVTGTLLATP